MKYEVTLRLTVEVDAYRCRPTHDDIAQTMLEGMRYEVDQGLWADLVEVEPSYEQRDPEWRGYDWAVTAVAGGDPETPTSPCVNCGRLTDQRAGSGRQRRYCSDACRQDAYRKRRTIIGATRKPEGWTPRGATTPQLCARGADADDPCRAVGEWRAEWRMAGQVWASFWCEQHLPGKYRE